MTKLSILFLFSVAIASTVHAHTLVFSSVDDLTTAGELDKLEQEEDAVVVEVNEVDESDDIDGDLGEEMEWNVDDADHETQDTSLQQLQESSTYVEVDRVGAPKCFRVRVYKLKGTLCVDVYRISGGFALSVTYNGKRILHVPLSAHNPPAICVRTPGVPLARLCVKFNDLYIRSGYVTGRWSLQLKIPLKTFNVKLGHFRIRLPRSSFSSQLTETQTSLSTGNNMIDVETENSEPEVTSLGEFGGEEMSEMSAPTNHAHCVYFRRGPITVKLCLDVYYRSQKYYILMTYNEHRIFKIPVSTNPPSFCFRITKIRLPKLCVKFSNLHVSGGHLAGQWTARLRIPPFKTYYFNLGKFVLPLPKNEMMPALENSTTASVVVEEMKEEQEEVGNSNEVVEIAREDVDDEFQLLNDDDDDETFLIEEDMDVASTQIDVGQPKCARIHVSKFKATICVDVYRISGGFALTVTYNGRRVLNLPLSAHNPPAICARTPGVPLARLCVKFNDLYIRSGYVTGRWSLQFKIPFKTFSVKLGHFRIRLPRSSPSSELRDFTLAEDVSVEEADIPVTGDAGDVDSNHVTAEKTREIPVVVSNPVLATQTL
jgi:hypothetical protein